jgi:3-dehydroquinate synthase II
VVVHCKNWKVIPLENLIAEFQQRKHRLYAYVLDRKDGQSAFDILEKGVDGIVLPYLSIDFARELIVALKPPANYLLTKATVKRIVDVGVGDRACVDTASELLVGEGLLVGNKSTFFFLVHSETIPSEYIPTRPFRVNAGAINSYLLGSDSKTRYLSELEAGDPIQVVSKEGKSRPAVVGRVKIERRPLVMVVAEADGVQGSILLQKAETIRLVRGDGTVVAVTELKEGEQVLVHVGGASGRHFGSEVQEFIVER